MIFAGLITVFCFVLTFYRLRITTLRRLLMFDLYVDFGFTIWLCVLFSGTYSGLMAGLVAGLTFSLILYFVKWWIGYEHLERYANAQGKMRIRWTGQPGARDRIATRWAKFRS